MIAIDKPTLVDVSQIKELVDEFARRGDILPRAAEDIAERIREFAVVRIESRVVATSSLRLYYPHLAEIRTIVVKEEYQKRGFASALIEYELNEARSLGVKEVFALTFKSAFFLKLGFKLIDKSELPQKKIWEDCIKCPLFPECREEAVIMKL